MPLTSKIYGRTNCVALINRFHGFQKVDSDKVREMAQNKTKEELDTLFVEMYSKLNPEEYYTNELDALKERTTAQDIKAFRIVWLAWLLLESPDRVNLS